jgi:transposase-like protein
VAKSASHSPEVKAAVIAALLAGQSVSQVAKAHKLPKGTVSNWKNRKAEGVRSVPGDETQKESIDDLIVTLVRESLKGLIAGARVAQDDVWMKRQTAAELGTFLGILNDKTARMLEAISESDRAVDDPAVSA